MKHFIAAMNAAHEAATAAGFTTTNFVGEMGEMLAHQVYGGKLYGNSHKSADLEAADGTLYQVKTRRVLRGSKFGSLRSFGFDHVIAIMLTPGYDVEKAMRIPVAVVQEYVRRSEHTNASSFTPTRKLLADPRVEDVTELFKAAHAELTK